MTGAPDASSPEGGRVLVVKLSSLGDLFHALPAVHVVRSRTGAAVDWVTQPAYARLVGECFDDVDEVIVYPRDSLLRSLPSFLKALRRRRYDLVLDLQGLLKSAVTARAARGGPRIGPSFSREGASLFYTRTAGPRDRDRHAVEEVLDALEALDLSREDPVFPVTFPPARRDASRPRVAFVPCSRWASKNWPAGRFAEVARALMQRAGASIVLLGAPGDKPVCEEIRLAAGDEALNLCGSTDLVEMGAVLQDADLVVSVDSGPMHAAAAAGTPVLAVFGPTDPRRTGPYGPVHRVIRAPGVECAPCRYRRCPRESVECLERITADEVTEAAMEMLEEKGR
jgi:lipopolysaccharide heptosyltransferase I